MNWLLALAIWMAVPDSPAKLYWSSLERPASRSSASDFSAAQNFLQERGLPVKLWTGTGFGERAKDKQPIWVIVAGPNAAETDAVSLKLLDEFTSDGGGVLILIRSDAADAGARSLLRHYKLVLNSEPVPAKIQTLRSPPFQNLRFHSLQTRLLDAAEEAFSEMVLVPNDLQQHALQGAEKDRSGFRMVLGKRGAGRIAVIAGAEAFANPVVVPPKDPPEIKHDNLEILLRVCRWLGMP